MGDKTTPPNVGAVASVRGSVVDIRFEEYLPPIYTVLRAGDERLIVIEVLAQRDARHVRGIALTPTFAKAPARRAGPSVLLGAPDHVRRANTRA